MRATPKKPAFPAGFLLSGCDLQILQGFDVLWEPAMRAMFY
jgi:hypothetical protein